MVLPAPEFEPELPEPEPLPVPLEPQPAASRSKAAAVAAASVRASEPLVARAAPSLRGEVVEAVHAG